MERARELEERIREDPMAVAKECVDGMGEGS